MADFTTICEIMALRTTAPDEMVRPLGALSVGMTRTCSDLESAQLVQLVTTLDKI